MDYKGYNIAIHALGHTSSSVLALRRSITRCSGRAEHRVHRGARVPVPGRATSCCSVPRPKQGGEAERLRVLDEYWNTREIAGSALVEIDVWHWLYDHPDATAAELREATVRIARETWNRYYAPVLGGKQTSPCSASTRTWSTTSMYTPDYTLAHLVAFQIRAHFDKLGGPMGKEFERVAQIGTVTPNEWMRQAVGAPLSASPLVQAAEKALTQLK